MLLACSLPRHLLFLLFIIKVPSVLATPLSPHSKRQTTTSCTNPVIRREWRELSDSEKQEYHRAVVCLKTRPARYYPDVPVVKTRADDFTWMHRQVTDQVHGVAAFLPFHRLFLQLWEDALRSECGYTDYVPFWDWTIDADKRATPQSPIWDPVTGFGGNGIPTGNSTRGFQWCVPDGPYANITLTIGGTYPDFAVDEDVPHCLTRVFNDEAFKPGDGEQGATTKLSGHVSAGDMMSEKMDSNAMRAVDAQPDFASFTEALECGPHAALHVAMWADMVTPYSPNEAVFYQHHANIDRHWRKWTKSNSTRLHDYGGWRDVGRTVRATIDDTFPVERLLDFEPVIRDYMDTTSGTLCYEYST